MQTITPEKLAAAKKAGKLPFVVSKPDHPVRYTLGSSLEQAKSKFLGWLAYLVMYLWHIAGYGNSAVGGSSMTITPMPSLAACEKVGAIAKAFADQQAVFQTDPFGGEGPSNKSKPAQFACFEADVK